MMARFRAFSVARCTVERGLFAVLVTSLAPEDEMTNSGTDKICFFCGVSCAGQPRGKDPEGRYYHKSCLESHQDPAPAPAAAVAAEPEPSFLDDLNLEPAASTGSPCSNCGQFLPATTVVCMSCGYNASSGKKMSSKVRRAKTVGGDGLQIGRWIVGGVSTLLGTIMVVSNVITLGNKTAGSNAGKVGASIGLLISLYLLMGGVGILRKQQTGLKNARIWAIIQLVFSVCCLTPLLVMINSIADSVEVKGADIETATALLVSYLVVVSGWAITILVWQRVSFDTLRKWD